VVTGGIKSKDYFSRKYYTVEYFNKLAVELEGIEKEMARKLVEIAHQVCSYSNTTRGSFEVSIKIVQL